ncbi:MAG TPA: hypothetical protein VNW95_15010 [Mucilaginibacter sp.]|jgi:hypothetical protein|nr:hypothetical protein [Mucilaginibacter sp.]
MTQTANNYSRARIRRCLILSVALVLWVLSSQANTITWTGAGSGDWGTAANWSPQVVPGSSDDVQIGLAVFTNQPALSGVFTCATMTIGSRQPVVVTIASGAALTVSGAVTLMHSEDNLVPGTTFTGSGSLTCGSLVIGNGITSKIIAFKTNVLISTLGNFTVMGNVFVNSASTALLSGGLGHNNSFFSLQGGQFTVGGQIMMTNLVPAYLPGAMGSSTPSSRFSMDIPAGQSAKLKVSGSAALTINNAAWGAADFYNGAGSSTVEYAGDNQIIATTATAGVDGSPVVYNNLVVSGTATKRTESSSGDVLGVSGLLTIFSGTLDLQVNRAWVSAGGDFLNTGAIKLSGAAFAGGHFTNKGSLTTLDDTVQFTGGNQLLADSTAAGTVLKNTIFNTGTKTISTGNYIIAPGGNWKMADDSTMVGISVGAQLSFRSDNTGQSAMTFKSVSPGTHGSLKSSIRWNLAGNVLKPALLNGARHAVNRPGKAAAAKAGKHAPPDRRSAFFRHNNNISVRPTKNNRHYSGQIPS